MSTVLHSGELVNLTAYKVGLLPRGHRTYRLSNISLSVSLFTGVLTFLKRQFLWWPLYPVGYAVGNGWAIGWMWFSIFLGWLFKQLLFTGGGVRAYRKALPLFLGFVFGQFPCGKPLEFTGYRAKCEYVHAFPVN